MYKWGFLFWAFAFFGPVSVVLGEPENLANELAERFLKEPQIQTLYRQTEKILSPQPHLRRLVFTGPLLAHVFYELQTQKRAPGYTKKEHPKTNIPFNLAFMADGDPELRAIGKQVISSLGPNFLGDVDYLFALNSGPPPVFSLVIEKSPDGEIKAELGKGFEFLHSGKDLTPNAYLKVLKEFSDKESARIRLGRRKEAKGQDLQFLVYLHSLGAPTPWLKDLVDKVAQQNENAEGRIRGNSVRGNVLSLFTQFMKEAHFGALADSLNELGFNRGFGKQLPARLGGETQFPSRMRSAELVKKGADGSFEQRNGQKNPFLNYVGQPLKDLPVDVLGKLFEADFTLFHRTPTAQGAEDIGEKGAFVSLGKLSATGGAASWGEGVYLAGSPTLHSRYGRHLVTYRVSPESVIGRDIDIFNGNRDGFIAVVKTNKILSKSDASLFALVLKRINERRVGDAIEILHQMPGLTAAELAGIERHLRRNPALHLYYHRRFRPQETLPEELVAWLDQVHRTPEHVSSNEKDILRAAQHYGLGGLKNMEEIQAKLSIANPLSRELFSKANRLAGRFKRLKEATDANWPQTIITNEEGMVRDTLSDLKFMLEEQFPKGPSLSSALNALRPAVVLLELIDSAENADGSKEINEIILTNLERFAAELGKQQKQETLHMLVEFGLLKAFVSDFLTGEPPEFAFTEERLRKWEASLEKFPELYARAKKVLPLFGILQRLSEIAQRQQPTSRNFSSGEPKLLALYQDFSTVAHIGMKACKSKCTPEEITPLLKDLKEPLKEASARLFVGRLGILDLLGHALETQKHLAPIDRLVEQGARTRADITSGMFCTAYLRGVRPKPPSEQP